MGCIPAIPSFTTPQSVELHRESRLSKDQETRPDPRSNRAAEHGLKAPATTHESSDASASPQGHGSTDRPKQPRRRSVAKT